MEKSFGMTTKKTAYNKVLPKAGLNSFDWTFIQGSTFVLRLNFSAKNPRLRQYPTVVCNIFMQINPIEFSEIEFN